MGYKAVFEDDRLCISQGCLVVMRGKSRGNLFVLEGHTVVGETSRSQETEIRDPARLWHLRLGHADEQCLVTLQRRSVFGGDQRLESCSGCVAEQRKEVRFGTAERFSREPLECVYAGVWGPCPVLSLGGARYFVAFFDDYSRRVMVSLMVSRVEIHEKVRLWRSIVERQMGRPVGEIRTNDVEIRDVCESEGISCKYTSLVGDPHGGVVADMKRMLVEKTRGLLRPSGLPRELWAEALATAVHLINRTPSISVGSCIPEELWTGRVVDFSHLRTFGCLVRRHDSDDSEVEHGMQDWVLLGYAEGGARGYRLWCPYTHEVIVRRHVIVDESAVLSAEQTQDGVERTEVSPVHRVYDEMVQIQVQAEDQTQLQIDRVQVSSEERSVSDQHASLDAAQDSVGAEEQRAVVYEEVAVGEEIEISHDYGTHGLVLFKEDKCVEVCSFRFEVELSEELDIKVEHSQCLAEQSSQQIHWRDDSQLASLDLSGASPDTSEARLVEMQMSSESERFEEHGGSYSSVETAIEVPCGATIGDMELRDWGSRIECVLARYREEAEPSEVSSECTHPPFLASSSEGMVGEFVSQRQYEGATDSLVHHAHSGRDVSAQSEEAWSRGTASLDDILQQTARMGFPYRDDPGGVSLQSIGGDGVILTVGGHGERVSLADPYGDDMDFHGSMDGSLDVCTTSSIMKSKLAVTSSETRDYIARRAMNEAEMHDALLRRLLSRAGLSED